MKKLTVLHVSSPQNSCGCYDCGCPSIGFIYARAENGRVWCYSYADEAPFVEGVTVLDPLDGDSHWFLVNDDEVPPSLQMKKVFCCWYNGGCQMPQAYGRTLAEAQTNFYTLNGFYNDVFEELEDATEWKLKLCENPKAIFD